jgi:hypothetical protein
MSPASLVETEFRSRGDVRGGILLLKPAAAIDLIRRCRELGVRVLGLDAFRITDSTTQPISEHDLELSPERDLAKGWACAERHLVNRAASGLSFEVTLGGD